MKARVLGSLALSAALLAAARLPAQAPELVQPGVISLEDRHETFPSIDPLTGDLWFSVYKDDFDAQSLMRAPRRPAGGWDAARVAAFSGRWGDRAPRFSPEGTRLYFSSNRPVEGVGVGEINVWWVERLPGGEWSEPLPGAGLNSEGKTYHATATASGAVYLASTRAGGFGRSDIYRVGPDGAVHQLPLPTNDTLSQPDLWVSPDEGWMILVITGHARGAGGDDLFASYRQAGVWGPPEPVGGDVNTAEYEYGPFVSHDELYLYFTSHRGGSADLYRIELRNLGLDLPRPAAGRVD